MNSLMTKSFLSYQDLKKEALRDLEAGGGPSDIEMSSSPPNDENLRRFFEEAGLVEEQMSSIRSLLSDLHAANERSKSLHKPEPLRSLRSQINSLILRVLKSAKSIRDRLESLDRANAASRRLSGYRDGTPVDRTRTSVTNGLRKQLKELMLEFQDLRQKMMAEYKETVERRYFTLTGDVPDGEMIDKIIANGESEDLVRRAVTEGGRGRVMEAVAEMQDRHDAAKEIERSLLELHQVFLDMAVMVEAQGERMDDIEQHVMSAAHYVGEGTKELATAKGYQRSSRKWMCIGIVVLMILVLLVLVPILASLHKS